MKKTFLFMALLLTATFTANAQFRVQNNGYISIQSSDTTQTPIAINCPGRTGNYITYIGNMNGIFIRNLAGVDAYNWSIAGYFDDRVTSYNANFFVGVRGVAFPNSGPYTFGRSYGVMGIAGNYSSGYNYGVFGQLSGTSNGAGVFGSISDNDNGVNVGDRYAGYFNGKTHIQGNLVVTGSINGVMLQGAANPSKSASSLGSEQKDSEQLVSNKLASLKAVSYYKEAPVRHAEVGDTAVSEQPMGLIERQIIAKQHYALDVNKLEEAFPELVYETEDGTRAINYTELIPLLVQSINELRTELKALQNEDGSGESAPKKVKGVAGIDTTEGNVASLAQNTPNPFTERTTIRFTLPENTQNAYIYIFDMMGKMQKQVAVDSSMQSVTINGYELSAGMYIYSLVVNGKEIDTKRMILSK